MSGECIRKRITKTSEFVYLIKPYLQKYFYDVNVAKLGLSKNYLYNRTSNIYKGQTLDKIKVEEINIENEPILEKHYLEIIGASISSYQTALSKWFNYSIEDEDLFIIPIGFNMPKEYDVTDVKTKEEKNILKYISETRNKSVAKSDYDIALNIELKFTKSKDIDAISVRYEENGIPIAFDSEDKFKNKYPLSFSELIKNMTYGTKVHEILEYIDFKNYDESVIEDEYIRKQITKFVQSLDNLDNANIFKEYEFYYEKDNISRHGIIDLLIEYDDHIDIIDYKLSNTKDDKYKDQLLGYREYIESISNKTVKTSLYSIIKGELEEI